MGTCPTDETFRHLLDGELDDGRRRALESHLSACEYCQERLDHLPDDSAGEIRRILGVLPGDATPSPTPDAMATADPAPSPQPGISTLLPGQGVLTTLARDVGMVPRILLRDIPDEAGPAGGPLPTGSSDGRRDGDRYQLLGEIARGGMGVVLQGRDVDLGRTLAIKVLLEQHHDNPDVVRRFVEEAQIGGQLQHPGIVPVYELGQFADRRPYFTMKLVKGQTLAALLAARTDPAHDLLRYLTIFEQVCQTMAYAHARGVIHRDLKPLNVMVGAFGEVQVMDWGLAKVLANDPESEADPAAAEVSTIRTVRDEMTVAETEAGSLLGTPAYMAPEQARGAMDEVDERADVFGLGAILCEILTGRPPYVGRTRQEVRRQAARADLDDALARLEGCGADAELIALARACLAPDPLDRPRDASAVAGAVSSYRAGVAERLRQAELARVEEHARAEHERQARLLTEAKVVQEQRARELWFGLVATFLVMVGFAGIFWWGEVVGPPRLIKVPVETFEKTAETDGEQLRRLTYFRDARKADLAEAHTNLGVALADLGDVSRAIAELRDAIRLKPDDAEAHYVLGGMLLDQGDVSGAIDEYREVIRLKSDFAEAYCNLGHALRWTGRYTDALAELKRGHGLGSINPSWSYPSKQWVSDCERMVAIEVRLPAILKGEDQPKDADERIALAEICYRKMLHGVSARTYEKALIERPALADEPSSGHRYNAACAAALAGCGRGQEIPPLDVASRARWRAKALDWLRADLAAAARRLVGGSSQNRATVRKKLAHWRADPDLAGLRDQAELAKLLKAEREACRTLWAEVDSLLKKAGGAGSPGTTIQADLESGPKE